ncbi:hypothetical protein BDB01DRAFT_833878 [Pilobolus umbonatus]|nr:hypothetical protein BDB01DRAFT_833878 [Pilobolus umbonatus]
MSQPPHPYYPPYPDYAYSQWPGYQPVPQGDPAATLNQVVYPHYQQYYEYQDPYYGHYYNTDQRPMVGYQDLNNTPHYASDPYRVSSPAPPPPPPAAAPLPEQIKVCCRKLLKSSIALAQHEKLHIKCPDCDKTCLPSYLNEHQEIFHGKKIETNTKQSRPDGIVPPYAPKIQTPEELAQWIQARKKNWPTQTNIEKKKLEVELKKTQRQSNELKRKADTLVDYGSGSDDDRMDPERDAISSKDPDAMGYSPPTNKPRPKKLCIYFKKGHCRNGEMCHFSHEKPKPRVKGPPPKKKNRNLLFKLLEKEIQQEKSVILQCIRYIVDNDYLES